MRSNTVCLASILKNSRLNLSYCKVANRSMSCLVAPPRMKGKFDIYLQFSVSNST